MYLRYGTNLEGLRPTWLEVLMRINKLAGDASNCDARVCDVIIQAAVFGEIIYG